MEASEEVGNKCNTNNILLVHIFWVVRHHRGYYSELHKLEKNVGFLVLRLISDGIKCDSH